MFIQDQTTPEVVPTAAPSATAGRAALLKAHTHALHERLDARIMSLEPFADRARYGRFLRVQYRFQDTVEAGIDAATLSPFVPDLAERRRLYLIARDIADLGLEAPPAEPVARLSTAAEMLGWLYVAEGSTLGAAFLAKEAQKLGLDESFGARHLAPHPGGRGLHWRRFTQALDAAPLGAEGDALAAAAAAAAFAHVRDLIEAELA
jgi:heme oxygenase